MSRYRKSNNNLTIDGETKPICDWAEEVKESGGPSSRLIQWRVKNGFDDESAVFTKPRKYAKRKAVKNGR